MSLFHFGKGKDQKDKGKTSSKDRKQQQNRNSEDKKSGSPYPDYDKLSREEAKALLAQRIHNKTGGVLGEEIPPKEPRGELSSEEIQQRMEERRKKRQAELALRNMSEEEVQRILEERLSKEEIKIYHREEKALAKAEKVTDRLSEKEEASLGRLEKALEESAKKDQRDVERAQQEAEEMRGKQKASIEKLQAKYEKEEVKIQRKEEKEKAKEKEKEAKRQEKDRQKREKEKKRKNSLINRYRRHRDQRFAMSDQRYYEQERQEKEKERKAIEAEKARISENKQRDRQDRKNYEQEIQGRKNAIIEREQQRARDMAKRREERMAEVLLRRRNRRDDLVAHERIYIQSVAKRENMLRERAERKLANKNRKAYYRTLPKAERRAKKEAYYKEQQMVRYRYLKEREEIIQKNKTVKRSLRNPVPCKKPGCFWSRISHLWRIRWNKFVLKTIKPKHRFFQQGAVFSNRLVFVIDRMDRRSDQVDDVINSVKSAIAWKIYRIRVLSDRHKRGLLGTLAGVVIASILMISFFNFVTGYEYAYNNRTLGLVKEQEDVLLLVDVVNQQLSKEHEALIAIDKDSDITFQRVFIIGKEVDTQEKVLRRLTYMQDLTAKGYGIFIEGTRVGILNSQEEAERALNRVLNNFLSSEGNTEYESVGFAETIEIKELDTKLGRIENVDEVSQRILTGGRRTDTHVVQAGETFAFVANKYGITQSQLLASNPNVDVRQLEIGQTLFLSESVPMVKVQTVETTRYIEYIPYTTTYQDDRNTWEGEMTTRVAGIDGQREVVAKIVRNNGKETAKMILEEKIISEPRGAVVLVGTKPPPPLQGTGSFIYPVSNYTLTSRFGMRWGRMHNGIDLAAPTGTKIRASDGGTVIFAAYNGELGYCVEIDHGGNLTTVYGHCSKIHVSVGDKVYQGQHIADVGNTGRSTGSHLHFEIRVLGVAKNPFNYL
jgi:murein DD-endopeptidase MepM/ murein hydrolase activator NlpD